MPLFAAFLNLGTMEWIVLAVLAVIIFGGVFWRMRRR